MRVLVTGGTGYIGSHTVVELVSEGHEVVVVDSLVNSKRSVLGRIGRITGLVPEFVQVDIRDEEGLDGVMATGFDAVVHFAGLKAVGESVAHPLEYYDANVAGSTTLFRVMARHGVRTVVFSSSATVYGDPAVVPVTEETPTRPPTNPYGWTKLMIEQILIDTQRAAPDWNVALLRYFNPVGAHPSGLIGEDPNDIPNNLMPYISQVAAEKLPLLRVFGDDYPTPDGTGVRDYIHVVDLARGHLAALDHLERAPGLHIWNLGTGRGISVLELVAAFERATSVRVPREVVGRRPGDVAETWAEVSKAERELGWRATLDVDAMCADSWRWQQYSLGLREEAQS
jgi:UDP-glucose 4-epimerase